MARRKIAVIGGGSFGSAVARGLMKSDCEVLVVDNNALRIKDLADEVTQAVIGDCRDRDVLEEIGIGAYDAVVVGLGESIEASTLVTFHLRDFSVRRIIVKAVSADHQRLLLRVGAHEVVFPESESAQRLAKQLIATGLLDYFELAPGYIIADVACPSELVGKTLRDLDLRKQFGVQVLLIQETVPDHIFVVPDPSAALKPSDILVIAGKEEDVSKLAELK